MGWFSKKPTSLPRAEELRPAEQKWLETQRAAPNGMAAIVGIAPDGRTRIEICDELIRWWHRQPEAERVDPNVIVNFSGVALGDELAAKFGLEWRIVTDQFGTNLALWRSANQVVISPTSSIAKRFGDSPDGCVQQLLDTASQSLAQLPKA